MCQNIFVVFFLISAGADDPALAFYSDEFTLTFNSNKQQCVQVCCLYFMYAAYVTGIFMGCKFWHIGLFYFKPKKRSNKTTTEVFIQQLKDLLLLIHLSFRTNKL